MKLTIITFLCFFTFGNSFSQEIDANKLIPIKENYLRVNNIKKWSNVKTFELYLSTEGGEVILYYSENGLEKIISKVYGEGGKMITEYYLYNNKLSFIFEKYFNYNQHVFQEDFDDKKTTIIENRNYFEYNKLIKQINSDGKVKNLKSENIRIRTDLIDIMLNVI